VNDTAEVPQPTDDLAQWLQQAAQLSDEGRWEEAFRTLHDQEERHGRDATLLCMLGSAARELGADDLAYDYFQRCIAEQPRDPLVLVTAGAGLAHFDHPDAEGALRLAALSAPHQAVTRLYYGAYLAREGLLELAVEELQAARSLDEEDPRVRRELGTAYLLAGRAEEGIAEMAGAVERDPGNPHLRLLYALSLLQERQIEEAAEELHRAAEDLPEDGEAQLLAAVTFGALDWADEAWNALARAELSPVAPSLELLQEAEGILEAGPEAAETFLQEQIAPSMLRERLLERP
jgi:predicted Zn-dependent protease